MQSRFNSINKYGYISDADKLPHQQMGVPDGPEKYMIAYIPVNNLGKFSEEEHRADQPYQQVYYLDRYKLADEDMLYQKNYGPIGDVFGKVGDTFGKMVNLTDNTVKTLAKSVSDNLVKPVSDQVAKQIVVPLGTEIISKIVVPITKKVAEQNQDMIKELTDKLMVRVEDFARLQIEKLKEDVKQEITAIPGKVLEKIKPSSWLPWKAESLDEAYSDTHVPNDANEFLW